MTCMLDVYDFVSVATDEILYACMLVFDLWIFDS